MGRKSANSFFYTKSPSCKMQKNPGHLSLHVPVYFKRGVHWVHTTQRRENIKSKVEKRLEESSVVHSVQDPYQAFFSSESGAGSRVLITKI
jgi:hypothetical protein